MAPPKSRFEAKPAATPPEVTPEPTVQDVNPVASGPEAEPEPVTLEVSTLADEVVDVVPDEVVDIVPDEVVDVVPDAVETSAQIAAPVAQVVETAIDQSKAFAKETVEAVEEAVTKTPAGLSALGLKAVENACVNASAYLDHVNDLIGAKSIPAVIELNTAFARKVAETLTAQARELGEIAQKTASDTAGSMKTRLERVFKHAA